MNEQRGDGWMQKETKKSYNTQTNCKHFQGRYKRLQLGNIYTCHGFLQRTNEFKETNSKTIFHKFIKQFVDKRLGKPLKLVINRIHETMKMTICNSKQSLLEFQVFQTV